MPRTPNKLKAISVMANLTILILGLVVGPQVLFGQGDAEIQSVSVGIESTAKLGKWVPVTIQTQGSFKNKPVSFEVTTLDSTATKVDYHGALVSLGESTYQAWAKIGRLHGRISVRLFDADKKEVATQSISVSKAVDLQASTSNHLLVVGGNEALAANLRATMRVLFDKDNSAVINATQPSQLPSLWLGLDGIDTVLVSTHEMDLLEQLSDSQWQALQDWVQRGGRLIISTNGKQGDLQPNGLLSRFLTGTYDETTKLQSMAKLDSFAKNRLTADSLEIANLTIDQGTVALADGDSPLVFRQLRDFGQIVFVSFDVADPIFDDWKGTDFMLLRLLKAGEVDELVTSNNQSSSPSATYGYRDLTGQLKVPLEQFRQVKMINFTVVAVLIGLYIICIGPGDFFFLRRFARRMELTWITFTLVTIVFCGLAIWLASWSRPHKFQFNQLEIVDIDSSTNAVRGNAWSNIFSPKTGKHEIAFDSSNPFGLLATSHAMSWHGTPGDGVGGMQAKAGLTSDQNSYRVDVTNAANNLSTKLNQLPLQVSSTRMLHTEWTGQLTEKIESNLRIRSSRLLGQISNPFPFELKNVRVIYGNYVYSMSNTLAANSTMDISGETVERTRKSFMNRQTNSADPEKLDRAQNMPWDPTSSRMDRIAEMMMFHGIAGGQDYTSLTHDFHSRIEMSEHLEYDQAIFVGEVDTKVCQVTIDGNDSTDNYDKQLTVIRILLPVD